MKLRTVFLEDEVHQSLARLIKIFNIRNKRDITNTNKEILRILRN